jgi:hypothetical protein
VPVAVPRGEYEVEATVNLEPLFGKVEFKGGVRVALAEE